MQGKQLRELEAELWNAADQLRANSKLTATEYSMPVLGLIFLRHAFNRFLKAKDEIEKTLPIHPQRGKRQVTKKDFEAKSAIYLPENARYDYLASLPENSDIGEAIDNAMKSIEEEYQNLLGVLPKNYSIFSKDLLRELLRIFNKEVLQKAEGDLFGKIYEYFLNKFAMTGAQEGGEFFTPFSLVNTIVNIIEPDHGTLLDPACGSAGMFVQTGYFIESEGLRPAEKVTFYGQEKADTNTKLAKMNLAVHGLEGNILEGNTFYEDKHNLVGKCDFVMANPPFNVDGVDKSKDIVKKDPRLPFGLPKNDNANYLWIQYFYSYLNSTGRAGFVMASSASDAGHTEKDIRERLVKSGAVDVMIAIGNNFFYTRSLPCTLWFFDRGKETSPPSPLLSGEGSIPTVLFKIPKLLLEKARNLRKNQTKAEELLWQLLRNRQLNNLKFRRQHPLKANYILDFFCAEANLGIELDGSIHNSKDQKEYDKLRTEVIKNYDIEIIRFKNDEIFNSIEKVLHKISEAASNRISVNSPLLKGEGLGVRLSEGIRSSDTVLMLDARKIYHKVTQKINDFSPEQLKNITCIVNLYRGNTKKFKDTVNEYLETSFKLAKDTADTLKQFQVLIKQMHKQVNDFANSFLKENEEAKSFIEKLKLTDPEPESVYDLQDKLINLTLNHSPEKGEGPDLSQHELIADQCRHLRKPQDKLVKELIDVIAYGVKEFQLNKNAKWKELNIKEQLDKLKELQKLLSGNPDKEEPGLLHGTEYFWKQAHWLQSRFPEEKYKDVEGLCKLVSQKEIADKDYSLSPGRYVGVDVSTDEDFDYEERLKEIHIELEGLNEEAGQLAKTISENYKELVI